MKKIFTAIFILFLGMNLSAQVVIDFTGEVDGQAYGGNHTVSDFIMFGDQTGDDGVQDGSSLTYSTAASLFAGTEGGIYNINQGTSAEGRFVVKRTDGLNFKFMSVNLTDVSFFLTNVIVEGYRDGSFVGSETISISSGSTNFVDVSASTALSNVDEIRFFNSAGGSGEYFAYDDLTFELAPNGYSASFNQSTIDGTNEGSASFTFAAAEVGTTYDYEISSDGGGTPVTGTGTIATGTDLISGLDLSGLNDGTLTLSVTLTNANGSEGLVETDNVLKTSSVPSGYSVAIDQATITSANESALSFTFAGAEIGATYNFSISSSGDGNTATVTGSGTITSSGETITGIDVSSLTDGTLTLSATLANGNGTGAAETDTVAKDATAPTGYTVTIDTSPINASTANSVDFTFASAEVGATYNYTFTSSGGGSTSGSGSISTANQSVTGVDLSALSDGTITLSVTLTDTDGNVGATVTDTGTKDVTAPLSYSVSIQDPINIANEGAVSFTFALAEVGATYNYTITSNGGGTPVTNSGTVTASGQTISGIDLSSLNDGTITISVTLTDANGNTGAAATDTSSKDTVAPTGYSVTINQDPTNSGNQSAVSFTFAGAESGTTYDYTFSSDGGAGTVTGSGTISSSGQTVSGIDLSGLPDGNLSLSITLTDAAGNTGLPATDSSLKDATEPTGYSIGIDQDPINSGNDAATSFTFSGAEVGATYNYTFSTSGGAGTVTGSGTISTATDQISGIDLSGLADGTITLSVTLTDTNGNTGSAATDTSLKDATVPSGYSVVIDQDPINSGNDAVISFTFSGAEAGATYNYTFTTSGGAGTVTGSGTIATAADQISGIDLSGLADGTITLSVTLTDTNGNTGSAATDTSLKDATAPGGYSVSIDQNPINASNTGAVSYTFSGAEVGATYNYTFSTSGGAGTVTGSGTISTATDQISGIDLSGLADGTITLSVTLTDTNGNTGAPATDTEVKDVVAPNGYAVSFDQSSINSLNVTASSFTIASAELGATYNYTISSNNGGTPVTNSGTVTSASEQITGLDLSGLNDGTLTITVSLTDVNGNTGINQTDVITKDVVAPTVNISSTSTDPTNDNPIPVRFTFSEVVSGFTIGDISISGGSLSNFSGTGVIFNAEITPSGDGLITVDVNAASATDAAGNPNTAATQFDITYDASAPTPVITSSLTDPTNTNIIPLTIDFGEVVSGLTLAEIIVSGGTKGNVTNVGGGVFTLDLTVTADGTYTVDIAAGAAQDQAGNDNIAATQFEITYDNTAPVVTVDALVTNDQTPELTGTVDDINATVQLTVGGSPYTATNNGDGTWTLADNTVTSLAEGTYEVAVTATDAAGNVGNDASSNELRIDTTAPTVTAGQNFTIPENKSSGPVGTVVATDPFGGTVFSSWTITGGDNPDGDGNLPFAINPSTGVLTVNDVNDLNYELVTSIDILVTVSDGLNTSSPETVTINLIDVNEFSPVISSASTFTLAEDNDGSSPVLDVNATDGDVDDVLTYSISVNLDLDGDLNNAFSINATTGEIFVNDQDDIDRELYETDDITVEVTDGTNITSQVITFTITDGNEFAPVITSDPGTVTIAENPSAAALIFDFAATDGDATDNDDDNLVWSITTNQNQDGDGNQGLAIDPVTGELTVNDPDDFDIEQFVSDPTEFVITVQVSDGTFTDTYDITIALTDVNEFTPVITSANTVSIDENPTAGFSIITVTATDDDYTASLSYDIQNNANPDGDGDLAFAIDAITGVLTVNDVDDFDREENASVTVNVRVSDGVNTATQVITVSLNDINDVVPVITAGQTFSVAEDETNGFVVGTVSATDGDVTPTTFSGWSIISGNDQSIFAINAATGQITIADDTNLDREQFSDFTLELTVSDGVNTSSSESVLITIDDVNDETPVIDPAQEFTISEDVANGTSVGVVTATDADVSATTFSAWTITAGNGNNIFNINATTGEISILSNVALDRETADTHTLTITVSDGVKTSAPETVIINVTDVNDNAPIIADFQSFTVDVTDNTATPLGNIAASDADLSPTLSAWTIVSGNGDGLFNLDAATGELTVAVAELLCEDRGTYTLGVTVSDGLNTSAVANIDIEVTDVTNAKPELAWYNDSDGDGYGAGTVIMACNQPAGTVDNDEDCDDTNADVNPETIWYADNDNDSFGDPNNTINACERPAGYVANDEDCDDTDDTVQTQTTWFVDADGDGFGSSVETLVSCTQPAGYVANDTDCNDDDADINPNTEWFRDKDGDGYGSGGLTVQSCTRPAGFADNADDCNDDDADINPENVWFADADGDGFRDETSTTTGCEQPNGFISGDAPIDCDDSNANVFPGAPAMPDGLDNDCDGTVDRVSQVITFEQSDVDEATGTFTLSATSDSDLTVQFEALTANISIAGNAVVILASGETTIRATQNGNAGYEAAEPVEITFCINPEKPTISMNETQSGTILTSSSSAGNVWRRNGSVVAGATEQEFIPQSPGDYTVQVVHEGTDCPSSEESDPVTVTVTGIEEELLASYSIYPNPVRNELHMSFTNYQAQRILVTNLAGKIVLSKQVDKGADEVQLETGSLANGIYLVQVIFEEGVATRKIIKQ